MLIILFPAWEETPIAFLTRFRSKDSSLQCKSLIKIPCLLSLYFCLLYAKHSKKLNERFGLTNSFCIQKTSGIPLNRKNKNKAQKKFLSSCPWAVRLCTCNFEIKSCTENPFMIDCSSSYTSKEIYLTSSYLSVVSKVNISPWKLQSQKSYKSFIMKFMDDPSLEVFKTSLDEALSSLVLWEESLPITEGLDLDDLKDTPSNSNYSTKLFY